jgi:hypothetical protein
VVEILRKQRQDVIAIDTVAHAAAIEHVTRIEEERDPA